MPGTADQMAIRRRAMIRLDAAVAVKVPAPPVLDLSKIEAGKLELNPQTVELASLINELIGIAGHLAENLCVPITPSVLP
jgi:signal transduction histidine kinase